MAYDKIVEPSFGEKIVMGEDGHLRVPDCPIIPFVEGDGTGPDITAAAMTVWNAAVKAAYGDSRKIAWMEVYAGEKANAVYGPNTWLPDETIAACRDCLVSIKGPLTTPVGGGIRSINVAMRQLLDLYVCLRPVRWFKGVPSPVLHPELTDMVIFRENTEDLYAGIEFGADDAGAAAVRELAREQLGAVVREDAAISIKPISRTASERILTYAFDYARAHGRSKVTAVHKANIMKATDGLYLDVARSVASRYPDIAFEDRIVDAACMGLVMHPEDFDVLVLPNLYGDIVSDLAAGLVGGLGMAPGANIGDGCAIFEATHGSAPDIAGKDIANPTAEILSACMLLEHLGEDEAAAAIRHAVVGVLEEGAHVTADIKRALTGSTAGAVGTSAFADAVIDGLTR